MFEPLDRMRVTFSWLWLAIAVMACAGALVTHMSIGLNNDTLLLTQQAMKLLAGGTPYVDFADMNPPLVYYIYAVPVEMSRLTGVPVYLCFNLFACTVTLLALYLCERMLPRGGEREARYVAVSFVGVTLLCLSFMHQLFADREYLMVTLFTPWLMLCSPMVERANVPKPVRWAAAVMAGIGFAIKPYSYVIYAATLVAISRRRGFKVVMKEFEQAVIIGLGLTYFILVLVFVREYWDVVVPVGGLTYRVLSWAWEFKWQVVTDTLLGHYLLVALAAAPVVWIAEKQFCGGTVCYLMLLLPACLLSYLLGGGWYYTQYPFIAVSFMLTLVLGTRLIGIGWRLYPQWKQVAVAGCLSVLLAGGVWFVYGTEAWSRMRWDMNVQRDAGHPLDSAEMYRPAMDKLQAHLDKHPTFLWLGINLWASNVVRANPGTEHIGRFDYMWMLPGTVRMAQDRMQKADYKQLAAYMGASVAQDIARHDPELIINDVSPAQRMLPPSYNVIPLLKEEPDFAQAMEKFELKDVIYTCNGQVQANCAYQVYYRKGL